MGKAYRIMTKMSIGKFRWYEFLGDGRLSRIVSISRQGGEHKKPLPASGDRERME
jgi:hypothetical protein